MPGLLNVHSHLYMGSQGFVNDAVGKARLRLKDKTAKEVGTNDKRKFIKLIGLPSDYKDLPHKDKPKVF